jgi:hypothetical protein
MEESHWLFELLRTIMQQLPSLLALVGCMVFALVRWKHHPRVSLVLSAGLLWLFLVILLFATANYWIPDLIIRRGIFVEADSVQTFYSAMSLTYNTGLAIGFALLLISIFMQRKANVPSMN